MNHTIGDYVVYGNAGICKLDGTVMRSFNGEKPLEYYKLLPLHAENSSYYIPIVQWEDKVRPLLTKEEIYALIDSIPNITADWCEDNHQRKNAFYLSLKSDDYTQILQLLKTLYTRQQKQAQSGKRLSATDEKILKTAKLMLEEEFSLVLGIPIEHVSIFIADRIEHLEESI